MMNTFLFTGKYLPLPHPTSSPTEPGDKFWRNRSTTGHGWWWMRVSWYLWCTHDGSVVVRTKTDLVSSQRKVPCYLLVYFMHIVLLVSFLIMGSSHVSVALWCNLGGGRWWPNEEWDEVVLPPVTSVNYTGFFKVRQWSLFWQAITWFGGFLSQRVTNCWLPLTGGEMHTLYGVHTECTPFFHTAERKAALLPLLCRAGL